jgi:hypothetical protein
MTSPFSLTFGSFLPFAAKFIIRHPAKFRRLSKYWTEYSGRYGKMVDLTNKELNKIIPLFQHLEFDEPLFQQMDGLRNVHMHYMVYYVMTRLLKPDIVVETGVNEGVSSAFILNAMEHNQHGKLYSIDLPNIDIELAPGGRRQIDGVPEDKETGYMVPDNLRSRWELLLGDAKDLLPVLLPKLPGIDIFIHDSLHSYDHMLFEYRTAWPYLSPNGILLSDDIDYNDAFPHFTSEIQGIPITFNDKVGALKKS